MADLLLAHGADINHKHSRNQTPLLTAIRAGDERMVMFLLIARADITTLKGIGVVFESSGNLDRVAKVPCARGGRCILTKPHAWDEGLRISVV